MKIILYSYYAILSFNKIAIKAKHHIQYPNYSERKIKLHFAFRTTRIEILIKNFNSSSRKRPTFFFEYFLASRVYIKLLVEFIIASGKSRL